MRSFAVLSIALIALVLACAESDSRSTSPAGGARDSAEREHEAPVPSTSPAGGARDSVEREHEVPAPSTSPAGGARDSVESEHATPTPATRLGSHLFVHVGESRSIAGLGDLIEAISMDGHEAFEVTENAIHAKTAGASCFRFRYRDQRDENSVQTICAVAFDEAGDCSGLERLDLDLNTFLDPGDRPIGDANLLEAGEGLFYAACTTPVGAYRLQRPSRTLPRLYWRMVDALVGGPYSLGTSELDAQRAGAVATFGGDEIRPPWIVSVSREVHEYELTEDGFVFNDEDCSVVPSCTPFGDTVLPGDVLSVGIGLSGDSGNVIMDANPPGAIDAYVRERIGIQWQEVLQRDPAIPPTLLMRLFNVDIMAEIIPEFDSMHDVRGKDMVVAFRSVHKARSLMPLCRPEPEAVDECRKLESAIGEYEARKVQALIDDGFSLWTSVAVEYREGGKYDSVAEHWRPHLSLFEGVLGDPAASSSWETPSIVSALVDAVRGLAAEVEPDQKVILTTGGPPIASTTGSAGFCEAEICPSDFDAAYEQFESWLSAALDAFPASQLVGIGTSLFEGSHFDIRDPYEDFAGFSLNRVGETGYNHPALNVWRAR